MSDYITAIRTAEGDKKIDYEALANLPKVHGAPVKGELVDLLYPVGSVYVTSTNTNAANILGGTWSLISKGFRDSAGEDASGALFTKSAATASYTLAYVRSGTTIRVRLYIITATSISDAQTALGTLNLAALGLTGANYAYSQISGASDGGNAIPIATVNFTSGEFSAVDIIGPASGTVASDTTLVFDFALVVRATNMLDSFCDKFYWKRIS